MLNWLRREIVIWKIRRHYRWVKRERILFIPPLRDPRSISEYTNAKT